MRPHGRCLGSRGHSRRDASAGPVQLFVQPSQGQGNGKILITGAIGDFGSTHRITAGGKTYAKSTLRKGTILFDVTAISAKVNSALPSIDAVTCSAFITATAPITIVHGTGRYKGISGTVSLTESFGFILPRNTGGPTKECNLNSQAQPVAQMGTVYGTGTVSF